MSLQDIAYFAIGEGMGTKIQNHTSVQNEQLQLELIYIKPKETTTVVFFFLHFCYRTGLKDQFVEITRKEKNL
ncbi:hypothetical protein DX130_03160 [Paenibacillus paeoniae]|uniref:Uncharacterized protein n=1 Tax=Paenibacillus paeoniae TaxID=2292705 RepID=A0A371PK84_9BACL|nr:hypothetical protein DX130_03160 [Paenibacillus paeoniae]